MISGSSKKGEFGDKVRRCSLIQVVLLIGQQAKVVNHRLGSYLGLPNKH